MRRETVLDLLLFAGFLTLLSFTQLPRIVHEITGVLVAAGICMHLAYAKGWLRGLTRGRWDVRRTLTALLNGMLALTALIVLVTGVIASNYLFRDFIPLELHRDVMLRQLHTVLGWLLPALIGLHIGLHGTALWQRFARSLGLPREHLAMRIAGAILAVIIIGGGIYASVLNRIGDRLRMEHIFATEASMLPGAVFVLLLLGMIGMYVVFGMILMAMLQKRVKKLR